MRHVVLLKPGSKRKGGLEKYTQRIASAFVEKGDQVTYLSTGVAPEVPGVHFHSFPIKSALSFRKIQRFDRSVQTWLNENTSDLVLGLDRNSIQTHLRLGGGVHAAFLKSRLFSDGKLKYYISHLNPLHQTLLNLEKKAYSYSGLKKIFTNSHMVCKELQNHYSVDPKKIEVVHNGVEWQEMGIPFQFWEEEKKKNLMRYQLDPHLFHILFVGHGYLRKGLDVLLDALSSWPFKDFHLSIIGNDKNLDHYQKKVKKLKMNHQVRFFGPQTNMIPFYQLGDVLAIPSFYDPFANVTVEALAMGLFVVSSKHNGGHEILTNQNGAIIEDLLDRSSLLEALDLSLKNKKTKQKALSIRHSVSHLDFSKQLNRLIDGCE
jgi:UDP-glucose:(heptosyl)LPS alpha-1,3-glucosyltransferase